MEDDELDALDDKERFVERGRQRKLGKLVPTLRAAGVDAATAETFTDAQWVYWVRASGLTPVKVPSETTRARAVNILRDRIKLSDVS